MTIFESWIYNKIKRYFAATERMIIIPKKLGEENGILFKPEVNSARLCTVTKVQEFCGKRVFVFKVSCEGPENFKMSVKTWVKSPSFNYL